jgi:nicotinate-nucleotide pyrophosphorylase (carboxylating)
VPVEIEVESLDELNQALAAGVERVLLDNFGCLSCGVRWS